MYLKDKGIFDDDGFSAEDICIEEIQPAFSEEGSADLFFGFKNESALAYFDDIYDTGWDEEDVWERLLIRYNPATREKTAYEWWDTPNDTDAFEFQLTDKE